MRYSTKLITAKQRSPRSWKPPSPSFSPSSFSRERLSIALLTLLELRGARSDPDRHERGVSAQRRRDPFGGEGLAVRDDDRSHAHDTTSARDPIRAGSRMSSPRRDELPDRTS